VAKEWGKGMLAIKYWKKRKVHHSRDEYGIFGGFHFFSFDNNKMGKKKHANAHSFPFKAKRSLWFYACGKLNRPFIYIWLRLLLLLLFFCTTNGSLAFFFPFLSWGKRSEKMERLRK